MKDGVEMHAEVLYKQQANAQLLKLLNIYARINEDYNIEPSRTKANNSRGGILFAKQDLPSTYHGSSEVASVNQQIRTSEEAGLAEVTIESPYPSLMAPERTTSL